MRKRMPKFILDEKGEKDHQKEHRGLSFAMCTDTLQYGRLVYDAIHPMETHGDAHSFLDLENGGYCDCCGSPLSKFCRGQAAHFVHNPLIGEYEEGRNKDRNRQWQFVCDLCIGQLRRYRLYISERQTGPGL